MNEHFWSMYALTSLEEGVVPMRNANGVQISPEEVAKTARNDRASRRKFRKIWRREAKRRKFKGDIDPHVRMKLVDSHVISKTQR